MTTISLFDGKINIKEPTHTFNDWISLFLLENFRINSFFEHPNNDNQVSETENIEEVPDFFLMELTKNSLISIQYKK